MLIKVEQKCDKLKSEAKSEAKNIIKLAEEEKDTILKHSDYLIESSKLKSEEIEEESQNKRELLHKEITALKLQTKKERQNHIDKAKKEAHEIMSNMHESIEAKKVEAERLVQDILKNAEDKAYSIDAKSKELLKMTDEECQKRRSVQEIEHHTLIKDTQKKSEQIIQEANEKKDEALNDLKTKHDLREREN
jgi:hypothetical protein